MATPALKAKDLGNKAYKAKQFDVAIQHYNEAIALDPTDITFYNNKGGGLSMMSSRLSFVHIVFTLLMSKECYNNQQLSLTF